MSVTQGRLKATVMDADQIRRSLSRIAHEIVERNRGIEDVVLIGIVANGDHIAVRLKALPRELKVRVIRCGDDHQANLRNRQQLVQAPDNPNIRIFPGGLGAPALQDGRQVQTGHGANHRRVERAASESESYEADFNHGHPSFPEK